ncbi:riboflavin biosynthesis protein RibF [Paenibacillus darwinianus]|uniref:Riboflavin biosynthesis protein n=1 Tax=Paenibacillus darwinianus TaxID=1380763 RepID=A0A9W5S3Q7_9BACL|nr:bifunctional riboflavin kinase/FAD synthetase [Paenibacillus darwinianus]EXX91212.1 riboflavin biosynthesis protein RibF [Paenibacillus darwinianus]EXX92142.1 riboflavin biosynthesis protein RibF [Paenibacillus darwinianus]EXX92793.1 riboflavin biosynthesis protein RibF [Paenibacillus darwinianus]
MEIIYLDFPFDHGALSGGDRGKVIAIGYFDGVHLGHRKVIGLAVERAAAAGRLSAVMTFHPHPKEVLGQGGQYATSLTPLDEKLRRFQKLGVDLVYVVRFDRAFAALSPESFVQDMLFRLRIEEAIVGFDFSFGSRGAGTPELLARLAAPSLEVHVMGPLELDGGKVSSSRIRAALEQGDVGQAERLLGRPYHISGTVVHGEGRGRTIGFPTANVQPDGAYVLPRLGVYAVTVHAAGAAYPAVMNVGVKPTFHENGMDPKLEAHLFGYEGDLYGSRVALDFHAFLRPERKFGSVSELVEQIGRDAATAQELLNKTE